MVTIVLRFRVRDYTRWREIFVSREALRREAGCLGRRVFRDAGDPEQVVVVLDWDEAARYEAYAATGIVQTGEGRARADIAGLSEEWRLTEVEDLPPWPPQAPQRH